MGYKYPGYEDLFAGCITLIILLIAMVAVFFLLLPYDDNLNDQVEFSPVISIGK